MLKIIFIFLLLCPTIYCFEGGGKVDLLDELHLCIKAINSLKTTYLELLLKEQFESTSSFSLLTGYNIA